MPERQMPKSSKSARAAPAESPAKLKRPQRLAEEVYGALYSRLMSHDISPGDRMSVDRLVRDFGVSQTPIREALSRLEAQGLVVKAHLIGYSAAGQMDGARFAQIYEIRLLLEPFAAEKACEHMADAEIKALRKLAGEMRAPRGGESKLAYDQFARLDARFHDLIAAGSGNELIRQTLASLHIHTHLFRLFHHASAAADAVVEHQDIIDAIVRRDGKAAAAAMRRHIKQSQSRFSAYFQ
jgi:DNA-binding GntR family transcriptional regulator